MHQLVILYLSRGCSRSSCSGNRREEGYLRYGLLERFHGAGCRSVSGLKGNRMHFAQSNASQC